MISSLTDISKPPELKLTVLDSSSPQFFRAGAKAEAHKKLRDWKNEKPEGFRRVFWWGQYSLKDVYDKEACC